MTQEGFGKVECTARAAGRGTTQPFRTLSETKVTLRGLSWECVCIFTRKANGEEVVETLFLLHGQVCKQKGNCLTELCQPYNYCKW